MKYGKRYDKSNMSLKPATSMVSCLFIFYLVYIFILLETIYF